VLGKRESRSLSVTMRTPGSDYELAAGFLLSEGIIRSGDEIHQISYCVGADKNKQEYNVLSVSLRPGVIFDATRLARHFYTTSSCGVCGKGSIASIKTVSAFNNDATANQIHSDRLYFLPAILQLHQQVFADTGGLHASALFDSSGELVMVREDVGRHNALDKLIGAALNEGMLPLNQHILLLSGRASFELVQKAAMAGINIIAAVGAPSSLAVELAEEFKITLIGFLRGNRYNIYTQAQRIVLLKYENSH